MQPVTLRFFFVTDNVSLRLLSAQVEGFSDIAIDNNGLIYEVKLISDPPVSTVEDKLNKLLSRRYGKLVHLNQPLWYRAKAMAADQCHQAPLALNPPAWSTPSEICCSEGPCVFSTQSAEAQLAVSGGQPLLTLALPAYLCLLYP